MQVPQARQTVQFDDPSGYRQPAVAPAGAFGGQVGEALSKAGDTFGDMAVKQKNMDDTKAVLDASNSMKMDMLKFFNGDNGLFAQQGDNAKGSIDRATQFFNDTYNKYASTLTNQHQAMAFNSHMKPSLDSYLRDAATHERQQGEAAYEMSIKTSDQVDTNAVIAAFTNPESMKVPLSNLAKTSTLEGMHKGLSADTAKQIAINKQSNALFKAFSKAEELNDRPSMQRIIDTFGKSDLIDQGILGVMQGKMKKINDSVEEAGTVDSIIKQAMLPDGRVDDRKAYALRDAMVGIGATKTVTGQSSDQIAQKVENTIKPFIGQPYVWGGATAESGFDCSGLVQYAYGKNGIQLPRLANDQYSTLREQGKTFSDPNQLKSGDLVFINTHTSQEFDADNPDHVTHVGVYMGNGKVLQSGSSGIGYKQLSDFNDIVGFGHVVNGADQTVSAYDKQKYDAITSGLNAKIAEQNRIYTEQKNQQFKSAFNAMGNITSVDQGMSIINSGDYDPGVKRALEVEMRRHLKIDDEGLPAHTPFAVYDSALQWLNTNDDADVSTFAKNFYGKVSRSDMETFEKLILGGKVGGGHMPWGQVIKDTVGKIDDADMAPMLNGIADRVAAFKKDNGRPPNTLEQTQMVKDLNAEIVTTNGTTTKQFKVANQMPKGTYWDENQKAFLFRDGNGKLNQWVPDAPQ